MTIRWRWDQGRTEYLQFDSLQEIAAVLTSLDNVVLAAAGDPLRRALESGTGLPFAPDSYRVWRNYKRVFGVAMLAADVNGHIICTQVCHALAGAGAPIVADDYLRHVVQSFYYPSPVFQGYTPSRARVYPFCAILKLLISNALHRNRESVSLDEVFSYLAGNECTGREPLSAYLGLRATARRGVGDETRQVREMMRFVSQLSFLKWAAPHLLLDVDSLSREVVEHIVTLATPLVRKQLTDRSAELLALGAMEEGVGPILPPTLTSPADEMAFAEGKKTRVTHLRTERSKKLRDALFGTLESPFQCDVCSLIPETRYPWVDNILEVHHLLPLGSAVRVGQDMTSISDLAAVCPNCHRAVHLYYREWLNERYMDDFINRGQAVAVYGEAKAHTCTAQ